MTRSAKIMLLGAIGVGKTSLAKRLVLDRFDGDYKTTIGVDILTYDLSIPAEGGEPGGALRLVIWDTDGDFGQSLFATAYIVGATGALIVADATRPASLEAALALREGFEARMPGRPALFVVNKMDLVDEAPALARREDAVTTSALSGAGVTDAFVALGRAILRRGL